MTLREELLKWSPELINSDHPFRQFVETEQLVAHLPEIDAYTLQEKIELATRIVLDFDSMDELKYLKEQAKSNGDSNPETSFYAILTNAYEVAFRIEALLDSNNPAPHELFLNNEINVGLFHQFDEIVKSKFTPETSRIIASRLAITTRGSDESALLSNIRNLRQPDFYLTTQKAFVVKNEVNSKLLGNEPWTFFDEDEGFNAGLYREFSDLVVKLVSGKDFKGIGELLAHAPREQRSQIGRQLENMSPEACNAEHPLKQIAAAFSKKAELMELSSAAASGLFGGNAGLRNRKPAPVATASVDQDDAKAADIGCCFPCTLF